MYFIGNPLIEIMIEIFPGNTNFKAGNGLIQSCGKVRDIKVSGGLISRIDTTHSLQHQCGVLDGTRHRTRLI